MRPNTQREPEPLLLAPETRVTCPKCEHEFSLADGFAKKSLEQLEAASHGALEKLQAQARAAEERRLQERASRAEALLKQQLEDMKGLLEAQRRQHAESLEQMRRDEKQASAARENSLRQVLTEREAELSKAEEAARQVVAREKELATREAGLEERVEREAVERAKAISARLQADLQARLEAQAAQLEQSRTLEIQLRRDRAELEARQQQIDLEMQRKLDEARGQIAEAARAAEAEKARLREADLQKKLDDMREKLEEAQRRAEQGSQQAQGEVLELLLEQQVGAAFPLDLIEEVRKGARGGDVVQRVMTRTGQQAGVILWEAKRAQNWSPQWPGKLKEDMRAIGADIGVLVATSLPREFDAGQHFGPHEDVWVTTPAMALQVAGLLRQLVESVHKQKAIVANRGEKAEALYDYLTSPQFAQKWKAVYGAFQGMQKELDTERTVTTQRWNRRERQIRQAVLTLAGVAGDIQGIAQQALPQLELEEQSPPEEEGDTG